MRQTTLSTIGCVRCIAFGVLLMVVADPALANKFETISGGVTGSFAGKRVWLEKFLWVAGGVSFFFGLLALIVPHRNPLYINYNTWKQSAIVAFLAAALLIGAAVLI